MKVLFVNTYDSFGGASRAAMRILHGLQQYGLQIQIFVKHKRSNADYTIPLSQFVPSGILYKAFDWIATKIKNQWQHHKWRPYKKTKKNHYFSDLRSTRIHGALQKMDYDIVHLHWINNRFLDIDELAKIHKPIVWTLHDSWPFTGICHVPYDCKKYETHCGACPMLGSIAEDDYAHEIFYKKWEAYKDLDLHIVTPSKWLGNCAKKSALLGRFPVHIIPNCIDAELYQPIDKKAARKELGLELNKRYLLFGAMQATVDKNKGFEQLLKALGRIKRKDVELIVYGSDENLEQYAIPIPYRSLGYIRDDKLMVQLYNAADICIVPSLSENLSNTIMESLSCGTLVVAFNIGGNGDMIDHMTNGYLAKERDGEDLACGIEWCLAHNADGALSMNAREKVLNNYTIDIVSNQYKQLYESL